MTLRKVLRSMSRSRQKAETEVSLRGSVHARDRLGNDAAQSRLEARVSFNADTVWTIRSARRF